jgi:hypothetical protein
MLAALDRQAKQAAALAAETLPAEEVVALRLGQRVVHRCVDKAFYWLGAMVCFMAVAHGVLHGAVKVR